MNSHTFQSMIFKHCYICLKEKKIYVCLWQLLQKITSEIWGSAKQIVYLAKPSQRELPRTALSPTGDPGGWGLDKCSYEVEVGLSGSRKHFLLQVRIKLPKYFQYWLSVCYSCFQTWLNFLKKTRHFGGISYIILLIGRHCTCLIQQMNNLDILNWLKNVLLLQSADLQF